MFNFFVGQPVRTVFNPKAPLWDRVLNAISLIPFDALAGATLRLGARGLDVAARALEGLRGAEAAADTADAAGRELAGAGGHWSTIDEKADPNVVQQANSLACVAACGEMLLRSRGIADVSQSELIAKLGTPAHPNDLPAVLNAADAAGTWRGGYLDIPTGAESQVINSLNSTGSWAAVMRGTRGVAHMVIVDGVDATGNLIIHDPWQATSYGMTMDEFIRYWLGGVYRTP